jgi:hypothetical protein
MFVKDSTIKSGLTGACKVCRYLATAVWSANNKDKKKILNDKNKGMRKQYYSLDSEKKPHHKNMELMRAFGISLDDYHKMLVEQNDGCAICGREETVKRNKYLSVDHCHLTNKVRGLLCDRCNRGIGLLGDSPERIRNAARYLERNRV